MMVSTLLFEQKPPHPYERCIVLGHVLDKAGKKESKSSGNYTPPEVILDAVRMEFAPVGLDAKYAQGLQLPAEGHALIGQDDLEGLDLKAGATVALYRKGAPHQRRRVKLDATKKLPRRVVLLSATDREALGLGLGPNDVRPNEVGKLPDDQRVMLDAEGIPAPGADAFRWFFYASNPPWNATRHALANVRAVQKELPIKLRNVYSFFVTYANIDHFDPVRDEPSKRPVKQRGLLDRWVLSELEKTKSAVVAAMDAFQSYEATQLLSEFVEGLSNWYVRRTRERFWAEGRSQDKLDAYWTLYQCLRDLSVMLAPFLPFAAEDMYQSLVVKQYGEGHPDSVHLRLYPNGDASRIDAALSEDMREVRELVSLGLQVRTNHKLKVRQPLREVEIVLSRPERATALEAHLGIMKEELNVMDVRFRERADDYVSYKVKPNFQSLGKRLGALMKPVQQAINAADPAQLKQALDTVGEVRLTVSEQDVVLSREDLLVQVEAKEGFAAASSGVGVVVLDTRLDDALLADGLFREVLSKVQARRKDLHLDFAARIKLAIGGSPKIVALCQERADALKKETLTLELVFGETVGGERIETQVEGELLTLEVALMALPRSQSYA